MTQAKTTATQGRWIWCSIGKFARGLVNELAVCSCWACLFRLLRFSVLDCLIMNRVYSDVELRCQKVNSDSTLFRVRRLLRHGNTLERQRDERIYNWLKLKVLILRRSGCVICLLIFSGEDRKGARLAGSRLGLALATTPIWAMALSDLSLLKQM